MNDETLDDEILVGGVQYFTLHNKRKEHPQNDDTPRTSSNRLSARSSQKPADGLTLKPSPLATASIDSNQSREAKQETENHQITHIGYGTHQLIIIQAHTSKRIRWQLRQTSR
jgi:hypothetical protein